jgi:hypothetical protein
MRKRLNLVVVLVVISIAIQVSEAFHLSSYQDYDWK